MKFSTKSRYALRLMEELAHHPKETCLSLKEISDNQHISLKYLEQIASVLTRAGLLQSVRGSHGGYRLTKAPRDYTAGEIIRIIEGGISTIPCLEHDQNACPRCHECRTLPFWEGLDVLIKEYIDKYTLEELAQQANASDYYSI